MKVNVDWDNISTYDINVGMLSDPFEISKILKEYKIRKYCYRIMFKGIVIKYGMSADNSKNCGERIYRQVGHSASWGEQRLNGSSGADWRIVEEDFHKEYGIQIDKNHMTIRIWDFTDFAFQTYNPWDEVNAIEAQLIDEYVKLIGEKPIGNINDEANVIRKAAVTKDTMNNLFTYIT